MDQAGPSRKPIQIDVVSDAVCPWCYIGKRNLEAALAKTPEAQAQIHWRPYQLDPTIPRGGLDRSTYMARKFGDRVPDIQRRIDEAGREAGISFAFDAIKVSPNTLDAHRVIRWAYAAGKQDVLVERLFRAFFVDGQDIGDAETLVAHAEAAGMDGAVVRSLLVSDADVEATEAEIGQARSLGVTGVPFYILDQRIGVSGAQPPDVLARVIRKALDPSETVSTI